MHKLMKLFRCKVGKPRLTVKIFVFAANLISLFYSTILLTMMHYTTKYSHIVLLNEKFLLFFFEIMNVVKKAERD